MGASGEFNASFKKYNEKSKTNSTTKTSTIGQESHHEEEVEVPPGLKVTVTMTTYRVRYQLEYSMEYTVCMSQKSKTNELKNGNNKSNLVSRIMLTKTGVRNGRKPFIK